MRQRRAIYSARPFFCVTMRMCAHRKPACAHGQLLPVSCVGSARASGRLQLLLHCTTTPCHLCGVRTCVSAAACASMAGTRRRTGATTPGAGARHTDVSHTASTGEQHGHGGSGAPVKRGTASAVAQDTAPPPPPPPIRIHGGVRGLLDLAAVVALVAPLLYMYLHVQSTAVQASLAWSVLIAVAVFGTTVALIPTFGAHTRKAGLWGKDLCKKGTPRQDVKVPEALGLVCGVVFIAFIIVGQLVFASTPEVLGKYNAALLSVTFMVVLGFADDVLDLRWRYKLVLPVVASLPLLCSYTGVTSVVMPKPLRGFVASTHESWVGSLLTYVVTIDGASEGAIVDLGFVYYVYMLLLAVFCTNSINIYAGINGLEAGQTLVIACFVVFTNILELVRHDAGPEHPHMFSAVFLAPFIGAVLALLRFNWFPSQVFVGDTFCYFSGMTLAVAGILGHFSKTLMLFFTPQIINFLYSVPQILKWWPCPRHRLPCYDPVTGLLHPSRFVDGNGVERDNLTLICLVLRVLGPMKERTLTRVLLGIQILCGVLALVVRFRLAAFVYDVVE